MRFDSQLQETDRIGFTEQGGRGRKTGSVLQHPRGWHAAEPAHATLRSHGPRCGSWARPARNDLAELAGGESCGGCPLRSGRWNSARLGAVLDEAALRRGRAIEDADVTPTHLVQAHLRQQFVPLIRLSLGPFGQAQQSLRTLPFGTPCMLWPFTTKLHSSRYFGIWGQKLLDPEDDPREWPPTSFFFALWLPAFCEHAGPNRLAKIRSRATPPTQGISGLRGKDSQQSALFRSDPVPNLFIFAEFLGAWFVISCGNLWCIIMLSVGLVRRVCSSQRRP